MEPEKFQRLCALYSAYKKKPLHYFPLLGNYECKTQGLTESCAQLIPLGSLFYLLFSSKQPLKEHTTETCTE